MKEQKIMKDDYEERLGVIERRVSALAFKLGYRFGEFDELEANSIYPTLPENYSSLRADLRLLMDHLGLKIREKYTMPRGIVVNDRPKTDA